MMDPQKEDMAAASKHVESEGAPAGAPDADKGAAAAQAEVAAEVAKAAAEAAGEAEAEAAEERAQATGDAEEVLDAVLEAEAAAIVDNAMDEVQAEAAANDAAKQAAEWKDKYMRLHAEWDTYRRRTKEQREEEKVRAAEKLVESLIPIVDDLERTIDYAQNNGETGLLSGVEAVLNKFVDTLTKDGVQVLDPAGEAFDALEAQAVGTVDDPSVPDETVAQVYQKGYKMGNKVLRPAMVTITTGGPKRPSE